MLDVTWAGLVTFSWSLYCYVLMSIAREKIAVAERIEGIFAALLLVCALFVGGAFKLFGIEPGIVASVLALVAVFSFIRYCVKDMHSHGPQSRPPLAEVKQRARMP